jgi:hypothetical protein
LAQVHILNLLKLCYDVKTECLNTITPLLNAGYLKLAVL